MEEINAISDCATIVGRHVSYLNLLDPLSELECAGGLHDGRNLRIYRTDNGYSRIAGQGGLEHPRQLGVSKRHVVTGAYPCQLTCKREYRLGVLLSALGGVLGQGRDHASQRE